MQMTVMFFHRSNFVFYKLVLISVSRSCFELDFQTANVTSTASYGDSIRMRKELTSQLTRSKGIRGNMILVCCQSAGFPGAQMNKRLWILAVVRTPSVSPHLVRVSYIFSNG